MITMDFTTTAMARPDIVNRTYKSFSEHLKGIDLKKCRLFINIDPLPSDIDRKEVTQIAEKYFGEVYPNYPEKANFTAACNWVWSNAKEEYIFNLEDDWLLLKDVPMSHLLEYFNQHAKLMQVNLRAYDYVYTTLPLSPSVIHERYYKAVAGKLDIKINPEVQLRGENFGIKMPSPSLNISSKGKIITYPKEIILQDIGKNWMKKSGCKKPKVKKGKFISWVEKQPSIQTNTQTHLTEIADKYLCDKGSIKHGYTTIYEDYFKHMRNDAFKMLEIGFGKGASVNMWLEYFPNVTLYCVDIAKKLPEDKNNLKFISANQDSIEQMSKIFENDTSTFEIVLDDGSHKAEDQMCSFGYLFTHLSSGGLYIIEDLNCKRGPNAKFGIVEKKVIKILKEYNNTGIFDSKILTKEQIEYIKTHISEVKIYKNKIAFIRKK